jgi:addiction module HigA family antidote
LTKGAEALDVTRQTLNNLVNGDSGISPEMAIRLEKAFGGTADLWLRMQAAYDLAQARKKADWIFGGWRSGSIFWKNTGPIRPRTMGNDMEDVTESVKQGLREVAAYQRGEIELPTLEEFGEKLENERRWGSPTFSELRCSLSQPRHKRGCSEFCVNVTG